MGTDIHVAAELRTNGKWELVGRDDDVEKDEFTQWDRKKDSWLH